MVSFRPLNTIGLPYYDQPLLSSWTQRFVSNNVYCPPPAKISPQILNTMKMNDNVAYATLPKEPKWRRNMVSFSRQGDHGRFRSGKQTQDVSAKDTFYENFDTRHPKAGTRHSYI
jgi:PAB-dependent poly(A)-specific ribonuclease subunit 2